MVRLTSVLFFIVSSAAAVASAVEGAPARSAALRGAIVDVNGHPVQGASVMADHQESGQRYTTPADDLGLFALSDLPPGGYVLRVELTGFRPLVTPPVTVELSQSAQLSLTLELERIQEQVSVQFHEPLLQVDSAVVGQTLSSSTALALPLGGRNVEQLALLLPGVVTVAPGALAQPKLDSEGRPFANGHREQGNSFVLDGVDANEPMVNSQPYQPSPDALEEVRFETNNYSAEHGNLAGAMIQVTLKSGTNQVRGSVFGLSRPQRLAANRWELNRVGRPRPDVRRSTLGGTLSGPIVRDRLFAFADYERFERREQGTIVSTVAPLAWRLGDFGQLLNSNGTRRRVFEPDTHSPYPDNRVPESDFSPVARALLARPELYPLPNSGTNAYVHRSLRSERLDQGDLKLTFSPGSRDNMSFRFTARDGRFAFQSQDWTAYGRPSGRSLFRSSAADWSRTFGVGGVHQLQLGVQRIYDRSSPDEDAALGDWNLELQLEPWQTQPGLSSFYISGLSGFGTRGYATEARSTTWSLRDQVSWVAGRHQLKAGADLQHVRIQSRHVDTPLGAYGFNGTFTNVPFGDFLLGRVGYKWMGGPVAWEQVQNRVAFFAEDVFRPSPSWTATIGLRWSYFSPWVEVNDRQVNFDLNAGAPLRPGVDGQSRALYEPYYRGFEPRLGLVWTPRPRLVVRAGYGIVQSMEGIPALRRLTQNPPFVKELYRLYDQSTGPGGFGFQNLSFEDAADQLNAFDPELKPQWTQQWNVFVEHAFSDSLSINVGYAGHRARRLLIPQDRNQPVPGEGPVNLWPSTQQRRPFYALWPQVGAVVVTTSKGRSRYDGLQAMIRQRPSKRLEFIASYTWSKAMTNNVHHAGGSTAGRPRAGYFAQNAADPDVDYGPSFFDATHTAALSGSWEVPHVATLSTVLTTHSGFPLTVIDSRRRSLQASAGDERPNRIGSGQVNDPTPDRWIDIGGFREAPAGTFGNSGVGILRGPGYLMWNLGLARTIPLRGRSRLVLSLQAFNVLNRPNFGLPARNLATPDVFGSITETIDTPRQVELGVKLEF